MRRRRTICTILGLVALALAGCGTGGDSPTGPTVNAGGNTITCAQDSGTGGAGGSTGDTTVIVTIAPNCTRDNPTTTTTTTDGTTKPE